MKTTLYHENATQDNIFFHWIIWRKIKFGDFQKRGHILKLFLCLTFLINLINKMAILIFWFLQIRIEKYFNHSV